MTTQGEYVNQITSGAAGKTTFPICQWNMLKSHGNFVYGQSQYNGFVLVHVTSNAVDVKWIGVKSLNGEKDSEGAIDYLQNLQYVDDFGAVYDDDLNPTEPNMQLKR